MKIYLVENKERDIKECFSNMRKVSKNYPVSYWGMTSAIQNKSEFRNGGFLITKMIVK